MPLDEILKMLEGRATVPLWPEAGTALGLKRNHTYQRALAGDIEVIQMGRLKKVSTAWLRKRLGLEHP
jgi:hypothetical protein